jgi:hypothetical protein
MPLIETETGGLSIDILCNGTDAYLIFEDDDNSLAIELILSAAQLAGTEWFTLKVVRTGTLLKVIIDKDENASETVAVVEYSGDVTLMNGKKVNIFDLRLLAVAISKAASDYYVDNLELDEGNALMPRW